MAGIVSWPWGRHGAAPHVVAPAAGVREMGLLAFAAGVYFGVRVVVEGTEAESVRNAERLIDFERSLGIDVEADIQAWALGNRWLTEVGNLSYVWLHWPLLLGILAVLWRIAPVRYRALRNAMFVSGAIGLVLFTVYPMAPPRFMPGFAGTVSDEARRHYLSYPLSWTNRFAAFPSFHVGWTLIACLALAAALYRHRHIRELALVPAGLVGLAVITTGNHYVLDSVVGGAIAYTAWFHFSRHPVIDLTDDRAAALHRPRASTTGE